MKTYAMIIMVICSGHIRLKRFHQNLPAGCQEQDQVSTKPDRAKKNDTPTYQYTVAIRCECDVRKYGFMCVTTTATAPRYRKLVRLLSRLFWDRTEDIYH